MSDNQAIDCLKHPFVKQKMVQSNFLPWTLILGVNYYKEFYDVKIYFLRKQQNKLERLPPESFFGHSSGAPSSFHYVGRLRAFLSDLKVALKNSHGQTL